MNFDRIGLPETRQLLLDGKISCREVVEHHLNRIDEGKQLNAFISVFREQALKKADLLQKKIRDGRAGKLAGAIVGVKDLIAVKDQPLTCASRMLENFISPYESTATSSLLSEDAIIIGKTNLDEFAMGSSTENSYFGPVLNPHDLTRVPGGSSGGSSAAVSSGMVNAALGTDTGGSIRQPASFCGLVGIKPTYGRVSRFGLVAFASSFDQIGPIARSVPDVSLLMEVISGFDERDSTSASRPVPAFTKSLHKPVAGLRIGIPREYYPANLDTDIHDSVRNVADILSDNGCELIELSLPHTKYTVPAYYILATAEASTNLERYDGVRFGYRPEGLNDLEEMYVKTRSSGFGREVKRRIMLGTYVLSAGYYDDYYRKAQQVRTLICGDFQKAFEQVDVLLTPSAPTTAFRLGEKTEPLDMYITDSFTTSANLAGLPAISVPCGRDGSGLPIGAQLIGKLFDEATIIRVSHFLETKLGFEMEQIS